jgi:FtsH-binding integral membrane protein
MPEKSVESSANESRYEALALVLRSFSVYLLAMLAICLIPLSLGGEAVRGLIGHGLLIFNFILLYPLAKSHLRFGWMMSGFILLVLSVWSVGMALLLFSVFKVYDPDAPALTGITLIMALYFLASTLGATALIRRYVWDGFGRSRNS